MTTNGAWVSEDAVQIDLLQVLPPGRGYEKVIMAKDVVLGLIFAYPVFQPTALNTKIVMNDVTTQHPYLPILIITHTGSIFFSQLRSEVAAKTGKIIKQTTIKHAQTIGVTERIHATKSFTENVIR